ncbi:RNA polymerase subunit sigma-70 [Amycolatopsis pithecellobii]|uniref:Sigma-70 family RNA polymerase sigma factor n=1 Tax=Amycolatopsis pithecellobii TaxID=664692 RepID=A0A6N7Z2K1_9PSEU|nr:RNA polymerase subunit sigma-70 [Amycolatopsis pithecellobii]MTD55159.1 sigma-70 family RNA polymerase sigma factor [Amycolatopsis pithecellobii]
MRAVTWDEIDALHRQELLGYCYRMLGSPLDAEEAVQETMMRAWRGHDGFAGTSSLRVWLFRIATNVCLDLLRQRPRREQPVDVTVAGDAGAPLGRRDDRRWIAPAPDNWLLPPGEDPAEIAVLHESVRLAFVAALHCLSPTQRATLILRDVLKLSADETATLLGITVAAANGLLRRARRRLATRPAPAADLTADQKALLERFVDAFERYDIPALTALLHDDATLSMPPYGLWLAGRSQLERWFLREASPCRGARAIPVKANGSPAFAIYHADQGQQPPHAFAIQLVTVRDGRIAAIDMHLDPRLFRLFGLPDRLSTGSPGVHSGRHDDLVSSHA